MNEGLIRLLLVSLAGASRFPMTLLFGAAINGDVLNGAAWVGSALMLVALGSGLAKELRGPHRRPARSTGDASIQRGYAHRAAPLATPLLEDDEREVEVPSATDPSRATIAQKDLVPLPA